MEQKKGYHSKEDKGLKMKSMNEEGEEGKIRTWDKKVWRGWTDKICR